MVFSLASLVAACERSPDTPSTSDLNLTIGVAEGAAASGDIGASQIVTGLTKEGLTQLSADGRVLPRLAEAWRWEDNGLTLRVILRPKVKFHDNTPLTADAVATVLRTRIADVDHPERRPGSWADVTSIEVDGDMQLLIRLARPSAWLPEDLGGAIETPDDAGTGPFRLLSMDGENYELARFDDYYLGRPAMSRVTLRPFKTLRTAWSSLLRGEVEMSTDVPPSAVDFVRNDDVQVVNFKRWYQYVLVFNSGRGPLRSPEVRRALNMAVDRASLIDGVLQGRGTASAGPIWRGHWAFDQSAPSYAYDPAEASALLDKAGFRLPASAPQSGEPPARFRFTCLIPENFSVWERITLELQRSLMRIGVDMRVEVVSVPEFNRRLLAGDIEAAVSDMISGPSLGRIYSFWRSAASFKGGNVLGYENPEAEALFNEMRRSNNDAAVRTATARLQRVFFDDPPAVFLVWNERSRAIRREFRVVQDSERDPLSFLWRWTAAGAPQTAAAQ